MKNLANSLKEFFKNNPNEKNIKFSIEQEINQNELKNSMGKDFIIFFEGINIEIHRLY